MAVRSGIVTGPIDITGLLEWAKCNSTGALVYFGGTTRQEDGVEALEYDAYVPRAEKTLAEIAESAANMAGVHNVALVHRIGRVALREESVAIVVAAEHRGEGWSTAQWMLEEVKRSVEIWKKEVGNSIKSRWIDGVPRA